MEGGTTKTLHGTWWAMCSSSEIFSKNIVFLEFGGYGGLEGFANITIRTRNGDFELFGMEHEARSGFGLTVDRITENGCTKVLEVDAELMCAASSRLELKETFVVVTHEDFIISLRRFTILVDLEGGRTLEVAADGKINHGFWELRSAFDKRSVCLVGFAVLELLTEHFLGGGVFGKNHNARSIAVKAVYEQAIIFEGGFGAVFAFSHTK